MDKTTTVIEKAKQYKDMVDRALPVKIDTCWLYGSYAKGTQNRHSDIDIAIEVNHIYPETLPHQPVELIQYA